MSPLLDFALGATGPFDLAASSLTDRDIRTAINRHADLASRWADGCVVEEVRCWRGYARADYLAAADGGVTIIEVKSDRDDLRRFEEQARVFSSVADRVFLVVGWALVSRVLRAAPWWWDVWLAERPPSADTRLIPVRDGATNPGLDSLGLASMLPVSELRALAGDARLAASDSRASSLRKVLAENVPQTRLRLAVHDWIRCLAGQRRRQSPLMAAQIRHS